MPQSLSRVIVHMVFSTHQRMPLLSGPIRNELNAYFVEVLKSSVARQFKLEA